MSNEILSEGTAGVFRSRCSKVVFAHYREAVVTLIVVFPGITVNSEEIAGQKKFMKSKINLHRPCSVE